MEIPININYLPGWRIISKKEGVSLNKDWTPSRWGLLTVFLDEKFPIGEKEKIEFMMSHLDNMNGMDLALYWTPGAAKPYWASQPSFTYDVCVATPQDF